jgi:hypothetical protein
VRLVISFFVQLAVLLIASSSGQAQLAPKSQDLSAFEVVLRDQFPQSTIGPFECSKRESRVLCNNLVSHPKQRGGTIGVNYLLELKPDGAMTSASLMASSPSMAGNKREAEYLTALYLASAIAILTVSAPDIGIGARMPFVTKVLQSGESGIKRGQWEFSAGSSIFATFSAKKL